MYIRNQIHAQNNYFNGQITNKKKTMKFYRRDYLESTGDCYATQTVNCNCVQLYLCVSQWFSLKTIIIFLLAFWFTCLPLLLYSLLYIWSSWKVNFSNVFIVLLLWQLEYCFKMFDHVSTGLMFHDDREKWVGFPRNMGMSIESCDLTASFAPYEATVISRETANGSNGQ